LEKEFTASGHFQYLEGELLEDIPSSKLAKFKVGIDYYGPAVYSSDLSAILRKELSLMIPGQSHLHWMTYEMTGDQLDFAYSTFIITKDGKLLYLADWLKRIDGLNVDFQRSRRDSHVPIQMTKSKTEIEIPELRKVSIDYNFRPPFRVFAEAGATAHLEDLWFYEPRNPDAKPIKITPPTPVQIWLMKARLEAF
jgi:hypothetical protein